MNGHLKDKGRNCQICGNAIPVKQGRGKIGLYCEACGNVLKRAFHPSPLRYSGRKYRNSPERINEIREKYRNGVSLSMIEEMVGNFCNVDDSQSRKDNK